METLNGIASVAQTVKHSISDAKTLSLILWECMIKIYILNVL